ncbi:hypothetical protein UVI_02053380 [Ustilaginoidea virens]|nr:hypothetical protein UVI_02053380 [Ustilaginoidea virens]
MPDTSPPGIPLDDGILVALEGKCVDEFGNILDWDGTVLGRAEGDLPSMVGRPVAKGGSILDAAGDLAGRVAEVLPPALTPEGESGRKKLKRDHRGNIYDQFGNVVGRMRTNSGGGSKATGVDDGDRGDSGFSSRGETGATGARPEGADETAALDPLPATPSPSEIYLDVKSTHDGIQLVIKIPTVFNGRHETMQCNVER